MNDRALVGSSEAMECLRRSIRKTAPTDMTVLIQGETGTGKELVARAIHEASRRAGGPFVGMNCATLPESLVESELFGYEKGAFTGADTNRKGKFELAHGGTLFLDEIGEISTAVQAKLLRALQEREIDKLGGQRTVPVDFRLIAATRRDLENLSGSEEFRDDLYHRLNVDLIRVPSLRERRQDIPELSHHFAHHYGKQTPRALHGVSPEVLDLFQNYAWPGNVRELQNVMQRAVLIGESDTVVPQDLPARFFRQTVTPGARVRNYRDAMEELSRKLCADALSVAHGNSRKAARLLDLNRTYFYRLARRHGLDDSPEP